MLHTSAIIGELEIAFATGLAASQNLYSDLVQNIDYSGKLKISTNRGVLYLSMIPLEGKIR